MGIYLPLQGAKLRSWLSANGREVTRDEFNAHDPGADGLFGIAHVRNDNGVEVAAVADMERERGRIGREDRRNPTWHLVELTAILELLSDFPPRRREGFSSFKLF